MENQRRVGAMPPAGKWCACEIVRHTQGASDRWRAADARRGRVACMRRWAARVAPDAAGPPRVGEWGGAAVHLEGARNDAARPGAR